MSFTFGAQNDDQEQLENNDKKGGGGGFFVLISVLFFPVIIVALAIYLLLRFKVKFGKTYLRTNLRPSVIFSIVVILEIVVVAIWVGFDVFAKTVEMFVNWESLGETWTGVILPIVLLSIAVGAPLGLFFVFWESRKMIKSPYLVKLKGNWMFEFEFRRTPFEMLRIRKYIKKLKNSELQSDSRSPLGMLLPINNLDAERSVPVYRYVTEASKHTLITGGSGSGKTITLQSMLLSDIDARRPTFLMDLKGSPEFATKMATWTHKNGGNFFHFMNGPAAEYDIPHSPGQAFYDPLKSGSPTSKADMVLGMREYDTASAVYKANMQELLQVTFAMLEQADRSKAPNIDWDHGGVYQIASAVAGSNIVELAAACEGKEIEDSAKSVSERSMGKTSLRHAIDELQGQMRTIVASEYGRWLKTNVDGKNSIDLYKMSQEPGTVVIFSLNSDSEPEFARYIGSMIMADFTATSARRRNKQIVNDVGIYIDEFQALNPDSVKSLLEKSRESRMSITLAQQSFEQVIAASPVQGEAYLLSILDTCSNFIVHAGATFDSAERLSKIIGKSDHDAYRASNKNENFFASINWANKRNQTVQTFKEERWNVEPIVFMKLSSPDPNNNHKSTAVIVNKTCSDPAFKNVSGAVARTVQMIPSAEVLRSHYTGKIEEKTYDDVKVIEVNETVRALGVPSNVALDESDGTVPIHHSNAVEQHTELYSDTFDRYDDEEDDDGGFEFETLYEVEEEEPDFDSLISYSAASEQEVSQDKKPVESKEHTKKTVAPTSSFMQLKDAPKVKKAAPSKDPVRKPQPKKETPPNKDVVTEKPESKLPDLDFSNFM